MSVAQRVKIAGEAFICEVKQHRAGRIVLKVQLHSKKRSGKRVIYEIEMDVERGSDICVLNAFKDFAKREQMEAALMAQRWGVTS